MVKNQNDGKIRGFFPRFFKNGYFLAALFFAAMALTACVAAYQYDLIAKLRSLNDTFIFVAVSVAIFALAAIIFCAINIKSPRVNVADSVGFAVFILAVIYFIYLIAKFGADGLTANRMIVFGAALALSLVYIIARLILFNPDGAERKYNNAFINYIARVIGKFGILFIIAVAAVFICAAYLALDNTFRPSLSSGVRENPILIYIAAIAAALCLIYAIICLNDKDVNALDAVLISGVLVIPVTLIDILLVNNKSVNQLTAWAIILGVYLIFVILRVILMGIKKEKPLLADKNGYFNKLFGKYNPFFMLAAAAVFTASITVFYGTNALSALLSKNGQSFAPELSSYPAVFLAALTALAFVAAAVLSAAGLKSKRITPSDFALTAGFAATVMSFSLLAITSEIYIIILLVVFTLYYAVLLAARSKNFNAN